MGWQRKYGLYRKKNGCGKHPVFLFMEGTATGRLYDHFEDNVLVVVAEAFAEQGHTAGVGGILRGGDPEIDPGLMVKAQLVDGDIGNFGIAVNKCAGSVDHKNFQHTVLVKCVRIPGRIE